MADWTGLRRVRATLAHTMPDRVPVFFSAVPEVQAAIEAVTGLSIGEFEATVLDVDYLPSYSSYTGPLKQYEDGSHDTFLGVREREQAYASGVYQETVSCPLAMAASIREIEAYPFPEADRFDHPGAVSRMVRMPDKAFVNGYHGIMYYAWQLRGMERFLEDLVIEPDLADALIRKIGDFILEHERRLLEAADRMHADNLVCVNYSDDFGTQNGLLISPDQFRRYFRDPIRRVCDLAHAKGRKVELHSCGAVASLVGDFLEVGVDVLNPVQTGAAGMDAALLKKRYGRQLVFSGGLDIQGCLGKGTADEVERETHRLLDILGESGGYIFGPTHNIQADTPIGNIFRMYAACFEHFGQSSKELRSLEKECAG